jgi:hypothetical protein
MSKIRMFLLAVVVLLLGIQLVPVSRTNPAVTGEVGAPAHVMTVLETSCYDCHSHETRWPWYAYVAPVSWLVAHDVEEGREHLNFSTWASYDSEDIADHLEEIWEEVEEGNMPLGKYVRLHPDAQLTDADRDALRAWTHAGPVDTTVAPDDEAGQP